MEIEESEGRDFLLVDDEIDMLWALGNILRAAGFHPSMATSGMEALRLIEKHRFRLAFVDAKLPDVEGLDLAAQLRTVDPEVRIVLVSGYFYGEDPDVRKALGAGVIRHFLGKPFRNSEVLAIARAARDR